MIAIALAKEPNPAVPLSRARGTHCSFMGEARQGRTTQIHVDRLSCPLARYYFGMPKPTLERAGRALRAWGDMDDASLAGLYLESGRRMEDAGPYIIYFPYPSGDLKPDVLVRVGTPGELAPIVHEHTRTTGERLVASISVLGAACGECTVYPLVTGRANVSLGCKRCRPAMQLDDSQLLLAAPRGTAIFDILAGPA